MSKNRNRNSRSSNRQYPARPADGADRRRNDADADEAGTNASSQRSGDANDRRSRPGADRRQPDRTRREPDVSTPQRRASDDRSRTVRRAGETGGSGRAPGGDDRADRRADERAGAPRRRPDSESGRSERPDDDGPRLPGAGDERRRPARAESRGPERSTPAHDARTSSRNGADSRARAERSATDSSLTGFDIETIEASGATGRHRPLEALWFELAGAWGERGVGPIALVAVPEMRSDDAAAFATRLAEVGAAIGGRSIRLITALDIGPSDAELLAELAAADEMTVLVVQSPTADPAAIPLLRRCTSVVPVVQLGSSLEDEVDQLVDSLGAGRVPTILSIDAPARRRWYRRGSKRATGDATAKKGRKAKKEREVVT